MAQLTDIAIRNSKPKEKPYKLSGSGLYLLIMPNSKRYFRWDFKFEGKRRTLAIGQYPDISLKEATAILAKAKEQLTQGVAPKAVSNAGKRREEARQVEGGATFENIANEWHKRFLDQWSDADHHTYPHEIDYIASSLSVKLKKRFTEWICELTIPTASSCQIPLLDLPLHARYLTFNYTNTLQRLYGVSPDCITYIHNYAAGPDSDLVLGHGVNPKTIVSLNADADLEDQDSRVTQANESIDGYFSKTYKPTDRVISAHQDFFDSLSEVKQIYVFGHSLSKVDWPYFALVAEKTKMSNPRWIASYYYETEVRQMKKALSELGLRLTNVMYARITDIHPRT